MLKDVEKLKKFSKEIASNSIVFYVDLLRYINAKIPYITSDLNKNHDSEHKKILIQKVYLQILCHLTILLDKFPVKRKHVPTKNDSMLFTQVIYDKAQKLFLNEEEVNLYKLKSTINIPRSFIEVIIEMLNTLNDPYPKDTLIDTDVWITKKGDEYFFDGEKMKLEQGSIYLSLFNIIYSLLGKKGGSISFDSFIKYAGKTISTMNTAPNRNKEKIYKTIRNTLLTNNTGIRRASPEIHTVLHSMARSHILTFENKK